MLRFRVKTGYRKDVVMMAGAGPELVMTPFPLRNGCMVVDGVILWNSIDPVRSKD